jgi:predicted glycoside hydrolase/deacetylase ChbG (UPF0249 family)
MKQLVINADDLGLADSVNRGIFETIDHGVVTSTSFMVNMPGRDDAARRLRRWRDTGLDTLGVGLHFNIVAGQPLTSCGTLLDRRGGRFLPMPSLVWRALAGRIDPRDVLLELEAQLSRVIEVLEPLGLRVTHIDSHRHVHCLPRLFEVVVHAAELYEIAHVRHPYESRMLLSGARGIVATHVLRTLASGQAPLDDIGFAGVGAMGSRTFDRDLRVVIAGLPSGTTELMVHPGYDSPELAAIDRYRLPREREVRALTSPALRDRILELGVQLTTFGPTTRPAPRARQRESEAS